MSLDIVICFLSRYFLITGDQYVIKNFQHLFDAGKISFSKFEYEVIRGKINGSNIDKKYIKGHNNIKVNNFIKEALHDIYIFTWYRQNKVKGQ